MSLYQAKYEREIWEKVPPVLFRVLPFSIFADPTTSLWRGVLSRMSGQSQLHNLHNLSRYCC